MKTRMVVSMLLLSVALAAHAADGVLVPIFYGDPGAFGSLWRTRLTIFNNSDRAVNGILINFECPIPEGCLAPIPPRSSVTLVAANGFRYTNGFLLYTAVVQPEVSYSVRVYDESRSGASYGTDIPVVPLDSFSEKQLELLDVPMDAAFRVTLRAYAIPPAQPRVRVSVFQDTPFSFFQVPAARLLSERFYDLTTAPFGPSTGSFARPAGIVIGDLLTPTASATPVRVEVQSVTPGVPVWAFASVTNNATQQVTVVVPRPSP
jgi:hypothetical protein